LTKSKRKTKISKRIVTDLKELIKDINVQVDDQGSKVGSELIIIDDILANI
jgi:hypothetical protein